MSYSGNHAVRRHSAPKRSSVGGRELIEEFVLANLEFGDLDEHVLTMLSHRVDVSLSVSRFDSGAGRLGHERTNRLIVGVVAKVAELLVDDRNLRSQRLQPRPVLREPTLDQSVAHEGPG